MKAVPLDERFPEWGGSRFFRVALAGVRRLSELLNHLYVLLPVLDDDTHCWIDEGEVESMLAKGEGWLETHPARDAIVRRSLQHKGRLARRAARSWRFRSALWRR